MSFVGPRFAIALHAVIGVGSSWSHVRVETPFPLFVAQPNEFLINQTARPRRHAERHIAFPDCTYQLGMVVQCWVRWEAYAVILFNDTSIFKLIYPRLECVQEDVAGTLSFGADGGSVVIGRHTALQGFTGQLIFLGQYLCKDYDLIPYQLRVFGL